MSQVFWECIIASGTAYRCDQGLFGLYIATLETTYLHYRMFSPKTYHAVTAPDLLFCRMDT